MRREYEPQRLPGKDGIAVLLNPGMRWAFGPTGHSAPGDILTVMTSAGPVGIPPRPRTRPTAFHSTGARVFLSDQSLTVPGP